jgi:hypothetical protein
MKLEMKRKEKKSKTERTEKRKKRRIINNKRKVAFPLFLFSFVKIFQKVVRGRDLWAGR